MAEDKQIEKWVDEEGYLYPTKIFRGSGCAAYGRDDVGLYVEYQASAVDQTIHTLRLRMTAEQALEMSVALRFYADESRASPSPHRSRRTR